MKQSQSNRRNRGRGNPRRGGGQGGQGGRGGQGNRSEPKVRGNAKQLLDKYKNLAQDALRSGDRVQAEHYFQHSDHYQRLVNEVSGSRENGAAKDNATAKDAAKDNGAAAKDGNKSQQAEQTSESGSGQKRRGRRSCKPAQDAQDNAAPEATPNDSAGQSAEAPAEAKIDGEAETADKKKPAEPKQESKPESSETEEANLGPIKFGEETAA